MMKNLSLMKDKLERYDYIVFTVEDYSDIKAEFIEIKPHLVLLDINLPNYDGFFGVEIRTIKCTYYIYFC